MDDEPHNSHICYRMHYAFHTLVLEELTSSHPGLNGNVIHYGTMIMNHTLQGVTHYRFKK